MKILKNYIFQEWLSVFLLSIIVISFVLMVGNMVKLVELVVAKGVNVMDILRLIMYMLPSLLVYSIPISTLTATLLSFGRMAYDQEITAIRASGVSLYPIAFSILLFGLLGSLICLYFNDSLIPNAHYQRRIIVRDIGIKNPLAFLEEKTFIKAFKGTIIFIYRIKDEYFEDVRIYQPQKDKPTRTIIAQQGEFIHIPEKSALKVMLRDGSADEPSFDDPSIFYKLKFKRYQMMLPLKNPQEIRKLDKKPQDMTIKELQQEIASMRELKVDERPLLVGLQKKFSLAFSSIVFVLIGIPLAIRVKRRERALGFGLSIVICVVYYLIMATGENLALRNILSPLWGAWLANVILGIVGLWLLVSVLES